MWRQLLNVLYLAEADELFRWAKCVRWEVSKQENAEDEQEGAV